ncbi:hypothetical protein TUMEXPCC7403_01740 [Tumidithrix helvetica PCC 7403]|uniref:hypothetical protein n=1 Tax=Tumidithrix helvetica TaxID=3457545 RepID=UPI003C8367E0
MTKPGEVLVAVIPEVSDMKIVREQYWYRIPVEQVERLKERDRWDPKWVAFYQPMVFRDEAFAVNYYAPIKSIRQVSRQELFPHESHNPKPINVIIK